MRLGLVTLCAFCLLDPLQARAQPKTEVEFVLKNCNKLEASVIFGASASGCLVYDLRKKEAFTTVEVCGGLMLKVALKEVVVGGEFGHEKLGCITIKTVLNPSESKTALALLKAKSPQAEEIRRMTLDQVKGMLRRANEPDLKALGIRRDQVDGLDKLRFESPRGATGRGEVIRKAIEKCPRVEGRALP
jgi:hypothetical protein